MAYIPWSKAVERQESSDATIRVGTKFFAQSEGGATVPYRNDKNIHLVCSSTWDIGVETDEPHDLIMAEISL